MASLAAIRKHSDERIVRLLPAAKGQPELIRRMASLVADAAMDKHLSDVLPPDRAASALRDAMKHLRRELEFDRKEGDVKGVERLSTVISLLEAECPPTRGKHRMSWHRHAPALLAAYKEAVGRGNYHAEGPAVAFVVAALRQAGWNATPAAVEQELKRAKRKRA